jgi:ABC-type cobalamin/Fe3+-siderophores transport system ATPase subunit
VRSIPRPNGAGKTTLIRLLLRLAEPTSGRMRLLGHELPDGRAAALVGAWTRRSPVSASAAAAMTGSRCTRSGCASASASHVACCAIPSCSFSTARQRSGPGRHPRVSRADPLARRRGALAEPTVKTHVSNLLGKLSLRDRVQAVIYAYEHKLVERRR